MSGLRVDLTGVEAGSFKPIPAGTYILKAVEFDIKETGPKSKVPGSPMVATQFAVDQGEYEGRRVFTNFTFGEKALPIFKAFLLAIGKTEAELEGELDVDPEDWMNKPFKARVKVRAATEEYEESNQISRYMAADEEELESSSLLP